MKLNVVIFRNRKIGAFTQPQFIDQEPEIAAVQLSRSLQLNEKPDIDKTYDPLIMFHLGTFDDESGAIDFLDEPKQLLDCHSVIAGRKEVANG